VSLGDVDGDGDLDALVGTGLAQANVVWLNNGSGIFADSGQRLGYAASRAVALGDVNGDGSLDAVIGEANGLGSKVWLNNAGQFTATSRIWAAGMFADSPWATSMVMAIWTLLGDVSGAGNRMVQQWIGQLSDGGRHLKMQPPGRCH
jgi:hypothetical protein